MTRRTGRRGARRPARPSREQDRGQDREIARLAVPAFLALVAEPLFLLADAAVVGHLGTPELAGLGVASVVLGTVVGLCVFLAYGTTSVVARHLGAGDVPGALARGLDGVWLAVVVGVPTGLLGVPLAGPLVDLVLAGSGDDAVREPAVTYLRIAVLGVGPLLVMLAATGVLRGLQDTRTPLVVAVAGNALNVALNVALVFGAGPVPRLGIAGSALGSVLAQLLSAVALVVVVARGARAHETSLRPHVRGVVATARAGVPLIVRTVTLRAAILVTAYAVLLGAAGRASVPVATHQLAITLWTFLAFTLDAVAIAAQALTGRALGAGDVGGARDLTRRMVRWGVVAGVVTGLGLAALAPVLGPLFTPDPEVRSLLVPVLLVAALGQPVAGVVFVLDGVLIGAGDGRYLARAGLAVLAVHAPVVLLVAGVGGGVAAVWVVFVTVFMGSRLAVLLHRARGEAWLVTDVLPLRG